MPTSRLGRLGARVAGDPVGAVLVAVVTLVALSWAVRERAVPAWDQADYLGRAWRLSEELTAHGPLSVIDALDQVTPGRAPLLPLVLMPFVAVFGPDASGALLANVVCWPVLLLATGGIAGRLFGARTRLLAMLVVATLPLVVGLSRALSQEFLLTTVTTVAVWLALRTDRFTRRSSCVALGVALGLGALAKVTFPLYVAVPLGVLLVDAWRASRSGGDAGARRREQWVNVGITTAIGAVIAGWWYWPHWDVTWRYLRANSGDTNQTIGTQRSFAAFVLDLLDHSTGWFFALAGLVALALVARRIARLARAPGWDRAVRLLVVTTWFVVPFVVVAAGKLQTQRYLTPAMPALAILLAAAVTRVPAGTARRAITALVVGGGILQIALVTVALELPVVPDEVTFPTLFGTGTIAFDGRPQGYDRLPVTRDDATPVVRHLARAACPDGRLTGERAVGLLQANTVTNRETMALVARRLDVPLVFTKVFVEDGDVEQLRSDLEAYDFALYVDAPDRGAPHASLRVRTLNRERYAAAFMTPELLDLFDGPSRTFPLPSGARVRVLSRSVSTDAGCRP